MEVSKYWKKGVSRGLTLLLSSVLPWTLSALIGQTYAFQHITDQDGLPSRYLYALEQDKEGHIWLSGEAGMVWFDGKSYKKPPFQSYLEDEIIKLYKDHNQNIWMQGLRGGVSLYKDGVYRKFDEIGSLQMYDHLTIYSVNEEEVWIASVNELFYFDYERDSLFQLEVDTLENQLLDRKIFHIDEEENIVILTPEGYFTIKDKEAIHRPYCTEFTYAYGEPGFTVEGKAYIIKKDGVYTFEKGCMVTVPQINSLKNYFDRVILTMEKSRDGGIWLLTRDGIIEGVKEDRGGYSYRIHLDGEVMGGMLRDAEDNLWFSTSHNGLYKLASTQVKTFVTNGLDKQLRFVKQNRRKQLVLGFDNNQYKVLNKDFQVIYEGKLFEQNFRLYDFEQDDYGNHYFITSSGISIFNENFTKRSEIGPYALKAAAFTPDGKLWLSAGDRIGYKAPNEEVTTLRYIRSYAVFPVSNEEVWFGTVDGPIRYKNGAFEVIKKTDLQVDVRDIAQLENGMLCLATQKNGFFIYDYTRDSILHHFTSMNGLSSDFCSYLFLDENYIWLSTKNGLNRINKSDYSISILGIDQGIPSNEINGIKKYDGVFYLATNKGLAYFDENVNIVEVPPRLELSSIRIEQKDTNLLPTYELDYNQNNIRIEFNGITFKNNTSLQYEYQMSGIDNDWHHSTTGVANYPSLSPGIFTFMARAKTNNTDWSEVKSVNFRVKAPLWQRLWFRALGFVAFFLILWLIVMDIKRRSKQARDLKASQLTAIRAQMNPHFVFNALNSIQEFIVKRDIRSTNRYLSQFARLMRNILNASDKEHISLKKEIETLRLYLSLEALRFGDQFNYSVEVQEDLNLDNIWLPPMLVQPFVENAVKHGLMHKQGDKILNLRFRKEGDYLVCEVEDNGVGRAASTEIRRNNPRLYTSKSTSLTQERLRVFNSMHRDALQLLIEDLKTDGTAAGTKVTIKIHNQFGQLAAKPTSYSLET